MSRMNCVRPACRVASGSVRASNMATSATDRRSPTFSPLTTHWSPWRSARQGTPGRTPDRSSLASWEPVTSWEKKAEASVASVPRSRRPGCWRRPGRGRDGVGHPAARGGAGRGQAFVDRLLPIDRLPEARRGRRGTRRRPDRRRTGRAGTSRRRWPPAGTHTEQAGYGLVDRAGSPGCPLAANPTQRWVTRSSPGAPGPPIPRG